VLHRPVPIFAVICAAQCAALGERTRGACRVNLRADTEDVLADKVRTRLAEIGAAYLQAMKSRRSAGIHSGRVFTQSA
jgi:hypothetical protein